MTDMIFLVLLFVGLLLIFISQKNMQNIKATKKEYNILDGEITYTDLDRPNKPLFSQKLRIAGKPDYIVKSEDALIPVEVKSCEAMSPFKNHILQLAAYCLLIENVFRKTVPYGVVVYKNGQHKIPFDKGLKHELSDAIGQIRGALAAESVKRNHDFPGRCRSCSFNHVCEQKLTGASLL